MNADLKRLVHDRLVELPPASVELLGGLGLWRSLSAA